MQILQGRPVSPGIAKGPVVIWKKNNFIVERGRIADFEAEVERLEAALKISGIQLADLQEKSTQAIAVNAGKSTSDGEIFRAQSMLLEDEAFVGQIRQLIRGEQVNAEYAVEQVGSRIAEMFAVMEDVYMREREADIRDIVERVLQNLRGEDTILPVLGEPAVIFAEELTPGDTMQFDRDKVLAFVTAKGSVNSHAAILARSMGIPAIVGIDLEQVSACLEVSGDAIVDATCGQLILNPDDKLIEEYNLRIQQEQERKELLRAYKEQDGVTVNGHKLHICANIGSAAEVQDALDNGAEGIGLFRSELLYLGRVDFPSEEEQLEEYKKVLTRMGDRQVIIRTLDIGADKQVSYFGLEPEMNPALGCRGIRVSLRRPDVFKVQLRALFRAAVQRAQSAHRAQRAHWALGNLAIMYPMITSVEEVKQIAQIVCDVAEELEEQGIPYKIPPQGIMIETPAAVMISDELAEMVDFFSIGTNDLTQYTLAIDRQDSSLDAFYNPRHKAILKMIQMVVENAHRAGKWVGICGELAADTSLTETFVRMGVDELSVAPGKVLEIRQKVREMKGD